MMLARMTPPVMKAFLYPLQTFLRALKVRLLAQAAQVSLLVQEVQLALQGENVLVLVK
jgi:hypothetical protein